MSESVKEKLGSISPATVDRLLKAEKKKYKGKGISHTKSGTLLKSQIKIRPYFTWDERLPGFCEMDTVAHDGGNARGEYCWTLTVTDVCTGWTETRALPNRAHSWVLKELKNIRSVLPYELKGLDSDNGGEFINTQVKNWCDEEKINFTRSRAYRKNDNCFVEQKNDMTVRHLVGYCRYEGDTAYKALQKVYALASPLFNFYYPSVKLLNKHRVDAKVLKKYDTAKTPYKRTIEHPDICDTMKHNLAEQRKTFPLVETKRLLDLATDELLALAVKNNPKSLSHS